MPGWAVATSGFKLLLCTSAASLVDAGTISVSSELLTVLTPLSELPTCSAGLVTLSEPETAVEESPGDWLLESGLWVESAAAPSGLIMGS